MEPLEPSSRDPRRPGERCQSHKRCQSHNIGPRVAAAHGDRAQRLARGAPTGFPHLERLPQDLAWHAASFLTARELMRCGEACRAHAAVCLEAHEPWDALRRRFARAAGLKLRRRPDDAKTPPARLFFADARAMPDRVAASAAADACVLVVDGRALDVTAFLDQHPGGGELLTEFRGRDASLALTRWATASSRGRCSTRTSSSRRSASSAGASRRGGEIVPRATKGRRS